jgi:hypothetical protein
VRRYAPRSFDAAQDDMVEMRFALNDKVDLISRFATASPIGEACVRRYAPRSFDVALARKGQGRRLRLAQDDMVKMSVAQNDKVDLISQRVALTAPLLKGHECGACAPRFFDKLRMTWWGFIICNKSPVSASHCHPLC